MRDPPGGLARGVPVVPARLYAVSLADDPGRPQAGRSPQSAGPLPSVTVAVCDWPYWSVQLMLILSPGWCWARADETSVSA